MGLIRLLLAAAVVAAHAGPLAGLTLVPGDVAVRLFFVISGFYMALVLTEKYQAGQPARARRFYASRFFRLYPAYLVVAAGLLAYYAAAWGYLGRPPNTAFPEVLAAVGPAGKVVLGAANLSLFGLDLLSLVSVAADGAVKLFRPDAVDPGEVWLGTGRLIAPAWSVSLEILFYLTAPWLAGRSTRTLLLLAAASLGVKATWAYGLHAPDDALLPAQLWLFLLGMLAYRWRPRGRWLGWVGLVAVGGGVVGYQLLPGPATAVALYLVLAAAIRPVFDLTGRWGWDRAVGELSYPLYLVHLPLILMAGRWVTPRAGSATALVFLVASLAAAVALHVLVERPFDRYRRRFARPPAPPGGKP